MFGDRPAGCALEVTKKKTAEARQEINAKVAKKLELGSYVDDSWAGRTNAEVDEIIGNVMKSDEDKFEYDGLAAQIYGLGGFKIRRGNSGGTWEPSSKKILSKLHSCLSDKGHF